MNLVQIICTEFAGFTLILNSTDAVSTLIDCSATIFLAEVDDIVLELYVNAIIGFLGLEVELEFAGIEFEGTLKDEKNANKMESNVKETETEIDQKKNFYLLLSRVVL